MPYFLIVALVAAFGSGFGLAYELQNNKIEDMETAIENQNHDAQMVLGIERDRAAKAEKAARQASEELDKAHESDIGTINAYHEQLVAARLHDPGRESGGCPLPKTYRAGSVAAPAGYAPGFSKEFAGFLKSEALRADTVAAYARTCRDFVAGLD